MVFLDKLWTETTKLGFGKPGFNINMVKILNNFYLHGKMLFAEVLHEAFAKTRKKTVSPNCVSRIFYFLRLFSVLTTEQRIYIEGNLNIPSVWILSVPFSLKGSSKCTIHVNVHKLYAVEYNNTVWSLDISITNSLLYKIVK